MPAADEAITIPTDDQPMSTQELAETLQRLNEAEQQAARMERLLDSLEAKMDDILQEAEGLGSAAIQQFETDKTPDSET